MSFYGNLIQYYKGQSHGIRWCLKMCSGIFLMVNLTIKIKKKSKTDLSLKLVWNDGTIKGADALDIEE